MYVFIVILVVSDLKGHLGIGMKKSYPRIKEKPSFCAIPLTCINQLSAMRTLGHVKPEIQTKVMVE